MALRVLLADESVTIKKVIQLALQDFAVEVKAVPVGLDVLEVSKSFQPDLVFADILLQKRSGYEVCADLKKEASTAAIPVVLMWSSFMELDQRQVDACGADGRLEKPFEVEALRKLVLELVPRTRSQRMAKFLEYPATMAAPLREEIKPPPPSPKTDLKSASKPAPKAPAVNPFASSLGAQLDSTSSRSSSGSSSGPNSMEFTHTPGIPDRPITPETATTSAPPTDAPLGALPDLQLEGAPTASGATASGSRSAGNGWNMESFEPLDLAPLTLTDDDEEDDSFKPLQLPQAEPSPGLRTTAPGANASTTLSLDDDEADADADQWANRSLDKYRLAPLKPDESLAIDDLSADFAANHVPTETKQTTTGSMSNPGAQTRGQFDFNQASMPELTTDKTEVIVPNASPPRKRAPEVDLADDTVPEFAMSDDDFNRTERLEIEPVEQSEKTRPSIVRELLRDPDFSLSSRGEKTAVHEGAYDLSSEGKPSNESRDSRRIEELVVNQLTPQLEKAIEKAIEKMLPQIAERIIKRELERLLEET